MESTQTKVELLSLLPDELTELLVSLGEPKYRAGQIFPQLHKGLSPNDMTNIGKATRQKLAEAAYYHLPRVERKLVSAIDGTVKLLFSLADGNCVESVIMKYEHGNTICISSQVGCRMGCRFCASTIGGRVRDLTAGELLGQVIAAQKELGERIDNIVMMGIGEPLDNFDAVVKFLCLVNEQSGICIGYRHISLSTCGIVPKMYALAEEGIPLNLTVSLHATDDETRARVMPVAKAYKIKEILKACDYYFKKTGRRYYFEYTLIEGANCDEETAKGLIDLLKGKPCHVNLIRLNEVKERDLKALSDKEAYRFLGYLDKGGLSATLRRQIGSDVGGACGQLRASYLKEESE